MKQILTTVLILAVILGLLSVILLGSKNNKDLNKISVNPQSTIKNEMVFFYGNTCPHCKETEKWMEENKIEEKLGIVKKEVYNNPSNARELAEAAEKCGLDKNSLVVPFLSAEEKCYLGTLEIENYLTKKAGL